MHNRLINKEAKLAVLGLGYIGLPLALAFAKKLNVIGFDIDEKRLSLMNRKVDPSNELAASDFENVDIRFTSSINVLKEASVYIVTVPTPVDRHNTPDLTILNDATKTVGSVLKRGDYVIYESTVYPGCTEEDCIPLLEQISGLKAGVDFKYGYSPERINPGDKIHTLSRTNKIVSGCDNEALDVIHEMYKLVVDELVYKAKSIKVAEAAKIIENTQRDVNIALMNELSVIFDKMDINTYDVIEAAETKWNFLKFYPGLVGGHCIGVDPYYMVYKANSLNYHSQIISTGRKVNDYMGMYIAQKVFKRIVHNEKNIQDSNALIMGITFKEDVSDIRNSKVVDIVNELKDFGLNVDIADPYADKDEVYKQYGLYLLPKPDKKYDVVIVAVSHDVYTKLDEAYFLTIAEKNAIFMDIKGIYKDKISSLVYMSL